MKIMLIAIAIMLALLPNLGLAQQIAINTGGDTAVVIHNDAGTKPTASGTMIVYASYCPTCIKPKQPDLEKLNLTTAFPPANVTNIGPNNTTRILELLRNTNDSTIIENSEADANPVKVNSVLDIPAP